MLKKLAIGLGLALVLAVGALVAVVAVRQDRTFDVPVPSGVAASTDPAVIERGRYLATGPAHCSGCHVRPEDLEAVKRGEEVDLVGGYTFAIGPVGTIYAPNITPDPTHGIGARSDGELARVLRHGVGTNGQALFPFMPFAHLAESDLVAVISYLRSRPARPVPSKATEWKPLGRVLRAFVLGPTPPTEPIPATPPSGATVENGRYLAHSVANCHGCHTERDLRSGAFTGQPFAGGLEMEPGKFSPNITTDPATGRLAKLDEEGFLARMRAGRTARSSHMPWEPFQKMSDDDLRAIYRYLKTVPPVVRDNPPFPLD